MELPTERELFFYGVKWDKFWNGKHKHIIPPSYPLSHNIREPSMYHSSLYPEDIVADGPFVNRLVPMDIAPPNLIPKEDQQIYVIKTHDHVHKVIADSSIVEKAIPMVKGYRGIYVSVNIQRYIQLRSLVFFWVGITEGIREEMWLEMSRGERMAVEVLLDLLSVPKHNGLRLWVKKQEMAGMVEVD